MQSVIENKKYFLGKEHFGSSCYRDIQSKKNITDCCWNTFPDLLSFVLHENGTWNFTFTPASDHSFYTYMKPYVYVKESQGTIAAYMDQNYYDDPNGIIVKSPFRFENFSSPIEGVDYSVKIAEQY